MSEWYGTLPERWNSKRVGSFLCLRKEKNNPVETDFLLSLSAKYGVQPYAERTEKGGNKPKAELTDYNIARCGDLLVNCMNVLSGSSGVTKWDGCISPAYYALFPLSDDINILYCNYIFRLITFYRSLIGLGKGILFRESDNGALNTIRLRISFSDLKNVQIPLPPRPEQDQIVRYLDWKVSRINKLINAKRREIELLKEQKQAIINITFDELSKNSQVVPCRHLGTFQNGISESGEFFTGGTPFITYGDVYNNDILPHTASGKAKSNQKQQQTYSVKSGDIFFTRTSETIDEVGLTSVCQKTIENAVFSGFIIRMRPLSTIFDINYARYYFRSKFVRDYFIQEMNLVTRASLGQTLLKNLPVVLPSITEQFEIGKKLNRQCTAIDSAINNENLQIELLHEYRTRLISDVATGKVDVRDVAVPDYEAVEETADAENENEEPISLEEEV
jgi:type I restriction enzyme S subunit